MFSTGSTDTQEGTPQTLETRCIAASKLPVNSLALCLSSEGDFRSEKGLTHPVKNRFPMLAPEKSNLLVGLRRLTISRFIELRKLRMSSFFGDDIPSHRG